MSGGGVELIAGAVVQRVVSMLGGIAWERIELSWNFKEDVDEMKNTMATLQVALNYADKRSLGTDDPLLQHWLKKYKSVAYDIEDALDELEANTLIWKNSPCTVKLFFSSYNPFVVSITMPNKLRYIRLKLKKIVKEQKTLNFLPASTTTGQHHSGNLGETYVRDTDEIKMVGRQREKKDIMKVLQKFEGQEIFIIPIVGSGGMGKTTIAKSVYTETNIFDIKAWVHVSLEFDLKKIVADIIFQIEGSTPPINTSLQYLMSQLDRILYGKFYLIVLDDAWEEGRCNLEMLMDMLKSGKKGSKVIVTTRNQRVASALSDVPSPFFTVEPIKLEGLSVDECWYIMKPPNLDNCSLINLEDIGKEIAQRCSGVPLVAKALGYVMQRSCTRENWLEIKNSNTIDIEGDDTGILKGLLLSYFHMPPPLKLCFMYCSIFPKSHDIDHDCLIQQWIALGYIQDTGGQSLQKIGMDYIDEFLGMSFLTVLTSTVSTTRIFKPMLKLRMHDMVQDLARYVSGDEFSCTNGAASRNIKRKKLNCHYHLLMNRNESLPAYSSWPTKVRAMHFRECKKMHLPKHAFSHTLYLRVLVLSGCHVSELPSSIHKLRLLRYIDASNLSISSLPKSLHRHLNLQTLILSNTTLYTLPTNIGCLQNLQYLDLSGSANLHELPTSFGNLSALLFLNLAGCHELHTLPESFGMLHSLQFLDLSRSANLHELPTSFGNLSVLLFLNLAGCLELHTLPESFGMLHCLQFLDLSDCYKLHSLPESCQLPNLTHLDLSDCHNLVRLPDCIGELSKLEYLNMTSCSRLQMLHKYLCKLVNLKHLNCSFCVYLQLLPANIGDLQLERLDLQGCLKLLFLPDSIFKMHTLKHVDGTFSMRESEVGILRKSLNLEGASELDGRGGDLWDQILELEKTPCRELKIGRLENVKHLEGVKLAKLSNCSKLTRLQLVWQHDQGSLEEDAKLADQWVLEKLVPPRSLQHLYLDGYVCVDFPGWMLDITSYLPHLTTIILKNLEGCKRLPPLGRLPNLRALHMANMPNIKVIGREFYGDHGSCQKLRVITMEFLFNLEEWWTTRSSVDDGDFLIPNLHMLHADRCPKLKFLPYPPRSLHWLVWNSDHVLPEQGFGNLISCATYPFRLEIFDSSPSSEVWRRAQYLSSVERLDLWFLMGRSLPDAILRCFTSLDRLSLFYCDDLEGLPEWLGNLTSLTRIIIKDCQKLSLLPESMRRLTKLELLVIVRCPALSEKCQGEDKHKIAHIPEVTFL